MNMNMNKDAVGIAGIFIGAQMLFVAFGALVLVPLLTGLDSALALFAAGVGTLIFHGITKGSIPIFLGSSFAFIVPIKESISLYGISATLGALACTGFLYIAFSFCFKIWGRGFLTHFFPSIVTGPVVIVIGIKLAGVATANCVSFVSGGAFDPVAFSVALVSLCVAIIISTTGRGFIKFMPILAGVFVGYVFSLLLKKVDYQPILDAAWFAIPWKAAIASGKYAIPSFNIAAVLFLLPVAIAPTVEHVGDIFAISSATGKNFLEKPGLHKTLFGDGIASIVASLLGGPPNTTYSEVTGAVALTKAFNPRYMQIGAVFAIIFAFCGKLNALLASIPLPVMGGIMMILFGSIAAVGIRTLVDTKVDFSEPRNMIIVALIMIIGVGDLRVEFGQSFMLGGIGLAGLVGILLNLLIPNNKG